MRYLSQELLGLDPEHSGCDNDQFNMEWSVEGEHIRLNLTTCFQEYRGRNVYSDYAETHHTSYDIPILEIAPAMDDAVRWADGWGDSWSASSTPFIVNFAAVLEERRRKQKEAEEAKIRKQKQAAERAREDAEKREYARLQALYGDKT